MSNILKINRAKKVHIKVQEEVEIAEFEVPKPEPDVIPFEQQLNLAYKQGMADGKAAGLAETKDDYENNLQKNIRNITQIVAELDNKLNEYEKLFEKLVVKTSLMFSEQIVRKKIEEESIVNETVSETIRKVLGANKFIVKVNPQDFALLNKKDNMLKDASMTNMKFEADSAIETGGCFIETDIGNADGRINSQLNEIKKAFKNTLFAEEEEYDN